MNIRMLPIVVFLIALLSSCSPKVNTLPYFQDINTETLSASVNPSDFIPKIEPSDELVISVSSLQPELSIRYNLPMTNLAQMREGQLVSGQTSQASYFVSSEGDIVMPVLGKIHVAGMTCEQLASYLTSVIAKDVKEPVVVVKMVNFKVNVGGEVARPGTITIKDNRFSILDALSQAGDLTPYGERTNVLLVREENGKREAHVLDLTSADILTSPYFFLKQNDYVYVAPNLIRSENSKYNQNNAYKLSVISTCVSAVSVIASLIIALVIR